MTMPTAVATPQVMSIGMGQIGIGSREDRLSAVLGSCVGVVVYHRRLFVGAMSHVVLPDSNGRDAVPGKFANTAIPSMIEMLQKQGVPGAGLVAKIAGGACMFGATGPMQIGLANAEAVREHLKEFHVSIVAEDIGGTKGRRIIFECESRTLTVEIAGTRPKVL